MEIRNLTLSVEDNDNSAHRISVQDLADLIVSVQRAMNKIGLMHSGRQVPKQGRIPKYIQDACRLDVVATAPGSFQISMALPSDSNTTKESMLGQLAIKSIIVGLNAVHTGEIPDWLTPAIARPLAGIDRVIASGNKKVRFFSTDMPGVDSVYDANVGRTLRQVVSSRTIRRTSITGLLLEIDFKDHTAEIHQIDGSVVKTVFDAEIDEDIRDAAKTMIQAYGEVKSDSDGNILMFELVGFDIVDKDPEIPQSQQMELVSTFDVLWGRLPDERSAEEILMDIELSRQSKH
jgi:hypothetical protein